MAVIADLVDAVFHVVSVNEIALDQRDSVDVPGTPQHDDPVKFRLGAFIPADRNKFYIGAISFDVLRRKDGTIHRTEVGFLKFAVDEFVEADGDPVPMVELFLGTSAEGSTDADIDRVMTISRKGCRFTVPIEAPGITAAGIVHRFFTDDGRFCYHFQGPASGQPEGAGIKYDTHHSVNESEWIAISRVSETPL